MIKTIKEWYNELPPHIKEKALKYAEERGSLDREVNSLINAIISGFDWGKTEEGGDYWREICRGNYHKETKEEIELPEILEINGKKYKRI